MYNRDLRPNLSISDRIAGSFDAIVIIDHDSSRLRDLKASFPFPEVFVPIPEAKSVAPNQRSGKVAVQNQDISQDQDQ